MRARRGEHEKEAARRPVELVVAERDRVVVQRLHLLQLGGVGGHHELERRAHQEVARIEQHHRRVAGGGALRGDASRQAADAADGLVVVGSRGRVVEDRVVALEVRVDVVGLQQDDLERLRTGVTPVGRRAVGA